MQPAEPISYPATAAIARDLLAELMHEHPEWEDFEWEVWT